MIYIFLIAICRYLDNLKSSRYRNRIKKGIAIFYIIVLSPKLRFSTYQLCSSICFMMSLSPSDISLNDGSMNICWAIRQRNCYFCAQHASVTVRLTNVQIEFLHNIITKKN